MILVTVPGAHLHTQAREDDNTNGYGGSAPFPSMVDTKQQARRAALERRSGCDPALGSVLADHLLASSLIGPGASVAGFWPLPGEIDLRPLLHRLHANGCAVCLPETNRRGMPLVFHRWVPGAAMLPGRFATVHPDGPAAVPDVLLVPLLAFDRTGGRLGYGGGYYDRTLSGLPQARAIGCAFAVQEVAAVPTTAHDIRLPFIATERGVISTKV